MEARYLCGELGSVQGWILVVVLTAVPTAVRSDEVVLGGCMDQVHLHGR